MKPASAAILRTLQRTPGEWINAHLLQQVGGLRYGARLDELRGDGFRIETRLKHHTAEYRILDGPTPRYVEFSCACGWRGNELTALAGHCARCGLLLVPDDVQQVILL